MPLLRPLQPPPEPPPDRYPSRVPNGGIYDLGYRRHEGLDACRLLVLIFMTATRAGYGKGIKRHSRPRRLGGRVVMVKSDTAPARCAEWRRGQPEGGCSGELVAT
jgi:hypothetical protein